MPSLTTLLLLNTFTHDTFCVCVCLCVCVCVCVCVSSRSPTSPPVQPRESSHFEFYALGQDKVVQALNESSMCVTRRPSPTVFL